MSDTPPSGDISSAAEAQRQLSSTARERFDERSIDFMFMDGSHVFDDVVRDIDESASAPADGAVVAFHDSVGWPGVRHALHAGVLHHGSPFRRPRLVDATLLTDVAPNAPRTLRDSLALLRHRSLELTLRGVAPLLDVSRRLRLFGGTPHMPEGHPDHHKVETEAR